MILSPDATTSLSSLGWIEHDALWRLDVGRNTIDTIPMATGARYASLHRVPGSPRFVVAHHFDGSRFELSVRDYRAPETILAAALLEPGAIRLTGDAAAWAGVPLLYVEYLAFPPLDDFVLLKVQPSAGAIAIQPLLWFDDSYDKAYQGVVGVLQLPDPDVALIAVQRSSRLILHDLRTGAALRSINLGGGYGGNPRMEIRDEGREVWANAYDTVAVVQVGNWQVRRRAWLQEADGTTQLFVGDYAFVPDADLCVVARPFSRDIVALDARTLKVVATVQVDGQPMEVAALPGGDVVAREWKTGVLLTGSLRDNRR